MFKINKKKFLPFFFTFLTSISIFLNSGFNNCEAKNENLYTYLTKISNDGIEIINASNKIEKVNLQEYLVGVIAGEIYLNYEEAAIKAQILAAKNFVCFHLVNDLSNNKKIKPIPINNTFQTYLNEKERQKKFGNKFKFNEDKLKNLVKSLDGIYIFVNNNENKLANTVYFSSSNGEKTENAKDVWGGDISYLRSVDCSFEKPKIKILKFDYGNLLNLAKQKNINANNDNVKNEDSVKIISKSDSGRIQNIEIYSVNFSGEETRKMLNLPSSYFNIEFQKDKIYFHCKGSGHGVGMSQNGANILAKNQNKNFEEIIKHYYKGVEIKNINQI